MFSLTFFIYILDAVDPLVLLLRCGSRDAVHHVVSFHYSPISLRLTRLNQLTTVVGDVQLKTVLLEKKKGDKNVLKVSSKILFITLFSKNSHLQVSLGLLLLEC